MAPEPAVLRAIEAALDAEPDNLDLALHLAGLELEAGEHSSALARAGRVLARRPEDEEARRIATAATEALDGAEPAPVEARPGPPSPDAEVVPLRAIQGGGGDTPGELERPEVKLADVGGLEHVKKRLEASFLAPLRNPKLRQMYGKRLRGGLMLYGPPGCGKTFLARAVAGELQAKFTAVGISDVLDMYLGESERKLHELFATARRNAPCVLFLDEVDALGQKRSHLRGSAGRSTVNQLLAEMDGAREHNDGVYVMAATNHPWDVDTALRRPGRLDRILLVLPPDLAAREAILRGAFAGRPIDDDLDFAAVAERTELCSGADLVYLAELATEAAMEEAVASGEPRPISNRDLGAALQQIEPSTRAWFEVAYNYAMFANEGGLYDELLEYIRRHRLK
jgi:SpoVK/Ycf46/Vps4 family AAA+-type ATPase